MNKLVIPTILATVLIAGMFAFMPIDKATTFHLSLNQGISGVTKTIVNTVSSEGLTDTAFHHFILSSKVPYTIHDITVKGEIENSDNSGDRIRVIIDGYPAAYGNNATKANEESRINEICDDCGDDGGRVVDGNDEVNPRTWSMNMADASGNVGVLTFGPNQHIIVEVCFDDDDEGDDSSDYTAMVTFWLRGVFGEGDVSVEVIENPTDTRDCLASE